MAHLLGFGALTMAGSAELPPLEVVDEPYDALSDIAETIMRFWSLCKSRFLFEIYVDISLNFSPLYIRLSIS